MFDICDKPIGRYYQKFNGAYILFGSIAPTPETLKIAQDFYNERYPKCEECHKTTYVCTCMLELEGFTS